MSNFPITVQKIYLCHTGNTKDYDVILMFNTQDKAVVVTRWGRIGTFGQQESKVFDNRVAALNYAQDKIRRKCASNSGYSSRASAVNPDSAKSGNFNQQIVCDNTDGVKKALSLRIFPRIDRRVLEFVAPEIDWKALGSKGDAGKISDFEPSHLNERESVAAKDAVSKIEAARAIINPSYGSW